MIKEEDRSYELAYYHENKDSQSHKDARALYNEKRRQGRPGRGKYGPRKPRAVPVKPIPVVDIEPHYSEGF